MTRAAELRMQSRDPAIAVSCSCVAGCEMCLYGLRNFRKVREIGGARVLLDLDHMGHWILGRHCGP